MNRVPSFLFFVAMAAIALFCGGNRVQAQTPTPSPAPAAQTPAATPPAQEPTMRKNAIHLLRSPRRCCNRA